jgi:2-amino-4-hydroxy-6-hydroxymethyldihydropteridine diphosphokinase
MTPEIAGRKVVAYLGLGANLDDPIRHIRNARTELQRHPNLREVAFSSLYRSVPMGPSDQPDYINAVMAVETALTPLSLLRLLQAIESGHGRLRSDERWGPRTLDLDLLLYGTERLSSPELMVPHPGVPEREFVLIPLFEIAPDLVIPGQGPVRDLIDACPRRESTLTVLSDV